MKIFDDFKLLEENGFLKDNYKMKCLKWYQRIKIFIKSWIVAIQMIPIVIKHIKENG
jgi:hypothetical protein